jgi:hypothetical protein
MRVLSITKKYFLTVILIFISFNYSYSQPDREQVGNVNLLNISGGAFYNYSQKNKVNIEVNIWGFVQKPGKYLVPKGVTVQDLISYAGGPLMNANLDEIRLFRPKNDSLYITSDLIITLDYNDLFWEDKVSLKDKKNPELLPGDILIFPGEPRLFFKENLTIIISIASVLISLGILVLSISRSN